MINHEKMKKPAGASSAGAEGARGEALAAAYLEAREYIVLERNYRCRSGEIDLIAQRGNRLVFVEVKTRKNALHGEPREYVTAAKQRRLHSAAMYYLMCHPEAENLLLRFDVAEIIGDNLRYTEDAFE